MAAANFSEHTSSHRIKYTKQGDYGMLTPTVVPVEYGNGAKVLVGTCEKCVFGLGDHAAQCVLHEKQEKLF